LIPFAKLNTVRRHADTGRTDFRFAEVRGLCYGGFLKKTFVGFRG
jgi:hypothetical protein